jgi:hypothetical protein
MDDQRLHGIPFTKPLSGDFGIHNGSQQIHKALSRTDGKGPQDPLISTNTKV